MPAPAALHLTTHAPNPADGHPPPRWFTGVTNGYEEPVRLQAALVAPPGSEITDVVIGPARFTLAAGQTVWLGVFSDGDTTAVEVYDDLEPLPIQQPDVADPITLRMRLTVPFDLTLIRGLDLELEPLGEATEALVGWMLWNSGTGTPFNTLNGPA